MFFLTLLATIILLSGCTSQTQKVYHVGILSGAEAFADIADGFKAKMTELGYVEGKNIVYDVQKFNGDAAGEKQALKRFVEDDVDLIFAFPTDSSVEAKEATQGTEIPVVFALAGIEGNNLVESVQHPGGLITGVRFNGPDNTVKRMEILLEIKPQSKLIGIFYDRNYPNTIPSLDALRSAAPSLGITLVEVPFSSMEELIASVEARSKLDDVGMDAILIMPEVLSQTPVGFGAIVKFANEQKLPIGGGMAYCADNGAVFSYIANNAEMGELAAVSADKIFKGTPAGTIPLVTPESRLRINYAAIQMLGLNVSEGLLARADNIIR
jgi:putative ABC transport system substrate-binding protein